MIFDIIFYVLGTILSMVAAVLGKLTTGFGTIPDTIPNAFTWFFAQISVFGGLFPLDTLFQALGLYFVTWGFYYLVKLYFWILTNIRIWKHPDLPRIHEHNVVDLRGGNVLNLRTKRGKNVVARSDSIS